MSMILESAIVEDRLITIVEDPLIAIVEEQLIAIVEDLLSNCGRHVKNF